MQYLPLYVIGLSKELKDNPVGQEKCRIFAEKLLSFLLCKAFNKNACSQKREHLSVRQLAMNYLASLLSRENEIIRSQVVCKCLQFTIRFYQTSIEEDNRADQTSAPTEASETDQKSINTALSQDKIFLHCFI